MIVTIVMATRFIIIINFVKDNNITKVKLHSKFYNNAQVCKTSFFLTFFYQIIFYSLS